ncbi:ribosome-releasing factor 2, mitochondrial isoform X2 [Euwallacea similis]|uniref:ribosome-releasing factor 2, mitochondrial isoform X2 n=1 Tax=Euwallacea similis TaxID=1736056 RepID=UPI00344EB8D1
MAPQVSGVEAQTLTIWRQADRFDLPRVVYINKMDRRDGDVQMCCDSLEKKLDVQPILLQLPAVRDGKLFGIIDVLSRELIQFGKGQEKGVIRGEMIKKEWPQLFEDAQRARIKVIEQLSDHSDELAEKVIVSEVFDTVPSDDIVKALRKVTLERKAVPVVLGSSYKNIGVQTLMDAITLYLPSPMDRSSIFSAFEDHLCGRAFKVKHDKQKGPLVFFRLYNGSVKKAQKIFSVQRGESEQIGRVYVAYADDFKEVETLGSGNIAVLSGLKKIMSGDLVTSTQSAYDKARKIAWKCSGSEDVNLVFGVSAEVPEPVFFCSIEPPSLATQQALDQALTELQREDPSLRVTYNSETGQTVLAGMGELHLEIIRDRILKEYKIEADLGPLQIAYREMPLQEASDSLQVDTKIGNHKNSVLVKLSVVPSNCSNSQKALKFDKSQDSASCIAGIFPKHLKAIQQGVEVGLAHGPKISSQIINANVILHWFEVGRGTSDTVITATVTQLINKLLVDSGTAILEPVMHLEVITPSEYLSSVLADLSRRRSAISGVSIRGNSKVVNATTPLVELLGYSTDLRTFTSGTAVFSTELCTYQMMSATEEEKAIRSVRGF